MMNFFRDFRGVQGARGKAKKTGNSLHDGVRFQSLHKIGDQGV